MASEPVIYNAAAEALSHSVAQLRDYVPPPERVEERDPIWNFEQTPGAIQEQTDLRGWAQKTLEDRKKLLAAWISDMKRRENEDPIALTMRRKKLHRRFLYIIGEEARTGGNREIAADAFKAIFPKE